jgi:hypothetical protein
VTNYYFPFFLSLLYITREGGFLHSIQYFRGLYVFELDAQCTSSEFNFFALAEPKLSLYSVWQEQTLRKSSRILKVRKVP